MNSSALPKNDQNEQNDQSVQNEQNEQNDQKKQNDQSVQNEQNGQNDKKDRKDQKEKPVKDKKAAKIGNKIEKNDQDQKEKKDKSDERVATLKNVVILLLLLFFCVYLISLVYNAVDFFEESVKTNALLRLENDINASGRLVDQHYVNLQQVVDQLESVQDQDEANEVLTSYVGTPIFGNLRYYVDSESYSFDGTLIESEVNENIELLALERRQGAVVYYDSVVQQDCVAFFLPVRSSSFVDGVLSVVPITDRESGAKIIDLNTIINDDCAAIAVIGPHDEILLYAINDDFSLNGNNIQSFLSDFTTNKEGIASVIDALHKGYANTESLQAINGDLYSISCAPMNEFGENAMLIHIFKNDVLVASEMTFIRHIVALLVVAASAFIALLAYAILYYRQSKKQLSAAMLTDSKIECPNVEQFRRNAIEVVYSQGQTYALLYYKLKRHHHLVETLGEQKTTEILRFVAKVFESFCTRGETYGYAGDGNFVLLNRYQNEKQLREKIILLDAVVNKSDLVRKCGANVRFSVGVYLTTQGKRTVPQMIECASLAAQTLKAGSTKPYALFSDEVHAELANNERIEARMEESLAGGEFKLFLQPKYNVKRDCIDSAEALVRWFDPDIGDYRFPGAFISLFESNGFIVKLDHFVYIEVLKYLSNAASRGDKIVPISVNVSRVTASAEDFLDFYIENKQEYGVGDDFITLEITESFAADSDEKLYDIVEKLHKSGIRCSIDDFGLGYSSFNTIKQIPIDELKIDRLFLTEGLDKDRDDKIIRTVLQLAKDINVSVVQEGVETEEMFNRVVEMGCEIIQGYYYAKAISLEEYRIFLNSNTSIKYKKKVK